MVKRWEREVVEAVLEQMLQHIQKIMKTVRHLESTIQRRAKISSASTSAASASTSTSTSTSASVSDSEKICRQLHLDAVALCEDADRCLVNRDSGADNDDVFVSTRMLTVSQSIFSEIASISM